MGEMTVTIYPALPLSRLSVCWGHLLGLPSENTGVRGMTRLRQAGQSRPAKAPSPWVGNQPLFIQSPSGPGSGLEAEFTRVME